MNAAAIIARIEQRIAELGLSARAASIKAGLSPDGIRNWQRRLTTDPEGVGITVDALHAVAVALGVEFIWLAEGRTFPRTADTAPGMAEDAQPFTHAIPPDADPIRALYADRARNASITHRAAMDLPGFGIGTGDLIVCDLSRLPAPGEVAIAVAIDSDTGTAQTLIRRYAPPFLLGGEAMQTRAIDIAGAGLDIRYPVIGVIRGT